MYKNQRHSERFNLILPIQLSFGTQITLKGEIKDLSLKSAFIIIKSSIHMAPNDELKFCIDNLPNIEGGIEGTAVISRVVPGEGIAIYFDILEIESENRLQQLIAQRISESDRKYEQRP
ncbi:MAG: PilZ domain-containing protein [Candidatus Omnitrophica bacterium]|nr:PilZ domain-containing protein [Candidatus Omnitrophota bacterium]